MRTRKGFTIVEVSLVVAIGGLILLTALIAVPSLTRIAKDSQRKTDMETLVAAIKKYQTNNNRGALPKISGGSDKYSLKWDSDLNPGKTDEWDSFYKNFLGKDFVDPDGTQYWLIVGECGASKVGNECSNMLSSMSFTGSVGPGHIQPSKTAKFPNGYSILVALGAKCDDNIPVGSSSPRSFAVFYTLESNDLFCLDG